MQKAVTGSACADVLGQGAAGRRLQVQAARRALGSHSGVCPANAPVRLSGIRGARRPDHGLRAVGGVLTASTGVAVGPGAARALLATPHMPRPARPRAAAGRKRPSAAAGSRSSASSAPAPAPGSGPVAAAGARARHRAGRAPGGSAPARGCPVTGLGLGAARGPGLPARQDGRKTAGPGPGLEGAGRIHSGNARPCRSPSVCSATSLPQGPAPVPWLDTH